MTLQEIFDISVGQIIKQGGLSRKANGMCAYRGVGGMMCAVGALMDDETAEEADALDPHIGADIGKVVEAGLLKGFDTENLELMSELQREHDGALDVDFFVDAAKDIAKKHSLEWRFA